MKQLTLPARASALVLSALLLGGCSLFGDDDELLVKELVEFTPTITPKILWEADAGDGIDDHFSRLSPTVSGDLVIAADRVGRVSAFNRETGARQWQVDHVLRVDAAGRWQVSRAMQARLEYVGDRPEAAEIIP